MLVLTRKIGESLRLGDTIQLKILSAGEGEVRVGIEAPAAVAIHREEVYQRIVSSNQEAARASADALPEMFTPAKEEGRGA